jgi:hypothetical protein
VTEPLRILLIVVLLIIELASIFYLLARYAPSAYAYIVFVAVSVPGVQRTWTALYRLLHRIVKRS